MTRLIPLLLLLLHGSETLYAGPLLNPFVEIRRTEGTGLTTGHVATLLAKNLSNEATTIVPSTFFIPSDLIYQSYVARIEKVIAVPANSTVEVKLYGFCADVSKPPARRGKQMIDFRNWILIVPPSQKENTLVLRPYRQIKPWDKGKVPDQVRFTLTTPALSSLNWPAASQAVGGIINPDGEPFETSSLIVAYLQELELATTSLQESGKLSTPFSNNPEKEYSTLVQHAFWLTLCRLTGVKYSKEVFTARTFQKVGADTVAQQQELLAGIDAFWYAISLVGQRSGLY